MCELSNDEPRNGFTEFVSYEGQLEGAECDHEVIDGRLVEYPVCGDFFEDPVVEHFEGDAGALAGNDDSEGMGAGEV